MVTLTPLFAPPGGPELLIILAIAIMLFGASKIPKLARSTGEAMGEFKKGREKAEQELDAMREGGSVEETAADQEPVAAQEPTVESEGVPETEGVPE